MSSPIARAICLLHPDRSAVARCPSCRDFFCSECITEHNGKLSCASCLARETLPGRVVAPGRLVIHPAAVFQFFLAVALCWTLYYFVGRFLGGIPDEFHDGTIWE